MAKDTFYFSHDYNARNDEKIQNLLFKHGFEGYGVYWAIVEELYQNTNVLQTNYERITFVLRANYDVVKSVIEDFELFVFEGDNFGSLSVQRRLDERATKSEKARDSVKKRWDKNTNVIRSYQKRNTIKERKDVLNNSISVLDTNDDEVLNTENTSIQIQEEKKENLIKEKKEVWQNQKGFKYLSENYPILFQLKNPLLENQLLTLVEKYGHEVIESKMQGLQNMVGAKKKYQSAYLTLNNWCAMAAPSGFKQPVKPVVKHEFLTAREQEEKRQQAGINGFIESLKAKIEAKRHEQPQV